MQRYCCQVWAYPESFGDGIDVVGLATDGLGFFVFRLSSAQSLVQLLLDIFFSAFRTSLFMQKSVTIVLLRCMLGPYASCVQLPLLACHRNSSSQVRIRFILSNFDGLSDVATHECIIAFCCLQISGQIIDSLICSLRLSCLKQAHQPSRA